MSESETDEESTAECRAKLYVFSKGHWREKGVGNVECLLPSFGCPTVVMYAEISPNESTNTSRSVLLVSKITAECSYELKGYSKMSIVVWREKTERSDGDIDYALSFQDSEKCWITWKVMMSVKPGYQLVDGKLMRRITNEETFEKVKQYMVLWEHEQKPFLPWQFDMTTWQSDIWERRLHFMSEERITVISS